MFKSLQSSKGQFFIISAVIIVSVLFSIYAIYLGYYAVDTSRVQGIDSTYLLKDVRLQTNHTYESIRNKTCDDIINTFDTFKRFVEKSALESGDIISYNVNNSRGCISTEFYIEVRNRDSKVFDRFTYRLNGIQYTFWNMYDDTTLGNCNPQGTDICTVSPLLVNNIDISNGIRLRDTTKNGNITYLYDPQRKVIWYNTSESHDGGQNVKFYWEINESFNGHDCSAWCRYNSFNDLPQEFRWLKEVVELTPNVIGSPVVYSINTTYAIRP